MLLWRSERLPARNTARATSQAPQLKPLNFYGAQSSLETPVPRRHGS